MNVGSGAWREYERGRIEKLREAAEMERKGESLIEILQDAKIDKTTARPLLDPPTLRKSSPKEDEIDPHLIDAQSGHYASPSLSGTPGITEDQYFRHQHRVLDIHRQNGGDPQPAQRQLAMASPAKQPLHGDTSSELIYGMHAAFDLAPVHFPAPAYVPTSGQSQRLCSPQPVGHVGARDNTGGALHVFRVPLSTSAAVKPPGPTFLYTLQNGTTCRLQPGSPQGPTLQSSGIEVPSFQESTLDPPYPTGSIDATPSKVIHLHSEQWDEAARRRADEFRFLT
jgi:hypothetical protein